MLFFTQFVFMFMVQLGYVNPENCHPDVQVWMYSGGEPVYIAGYSCLVEPPLRSRQR